MVDPDYHDQHGDHGQPDPAAAAALEAAARAGKLPGSIFSATGVGRSTRVIAVLPANVTDPDLALAAIRGLGELLERALRDLGLAATLGPYGKRSSGYAVDASAVDLARLFWRPNAIIGGERREAEVLVMRAEPIEVHELASQAPPPKQPPVALRASAPHVVGPRVGASSEEVRTAWRRWVDDHPREWGAPGNGICPACTRPGFGRLPAQPWRWCCWSASHGVRTEGRCGRESKGKWIGDALYLEAYARSCRPVDVLRQDGYLLSKAEARRRGHRIGPATLAGALRKAIGRVKSGGAVSERPAR